MKVVPPLRAPMSNMTREQIESLKFFESMLFNLTEKVRVLELDRVSEKLKLGSTPSSNFNAGDTAWMLVATALVFFMTIPGLTLYYAGMTSEKKNLMTIAMQSFSICSLVTLTWMFFGYSLAFTSYSGVIGGSSRFFLLNLPSGIGHPLAPSIPEHIFCTYQLGFAVVTASLLCGASADRMKFSSMLLFVAVWHVLVYCPIAHATWNAGGFLHMAGVLDWAGGNVVHITAGMSGLITSMVVGKRYGYGEQRFTPNNMLHTITGACFLWVGWFGFNGGSSFEADERACRAVLMTQIATSIAAFSWILMEQIVTKQPTVLGMLNGAVAGLVSITPAAGYVDPTGAFIIGLLSGPVCYYGTNVKKRLGLDDALDAFGLHGIAGIYGMLMTGLFANCAEATGSLYGNRNQVAIQLYGITCTVGWSMSVTYVALLAIKATVGLRVSVSTEKSGLDRSFHGEGLYVARSKTVTPSERVAELLKAYAEAKARSFDPADVLVVTNTSINTNMNMDIREAVEECFSDDSSLTNSDGNEEGHTNVL